MKKALLLEDDSALGKGISLALNSQELQIDLCRTLCEAMDKSVSEYALLILDINCQMAADWTICVNCEPTVAPFRLLC